MSAKKRSRAGGMSTSKILMTSAGIVGGVAAAGLIGKSSFATANPILKIALPIGGAIALPMLLGKGNISTMLSTGMVVAGLTNAVAQFAPGLATTVGLAGGMPGVSGASQWKTNYNPGIAGGGASVIL